MFPDVLLKIIQHAIKTKDKYVQQLEIKIHLATVLFKLININARLIQQIHKINVMILYLVGTFR